MTNGTPNEMYKIVCLVWLFHHNDFVTAFLMCSTILHSGRDACMHILPGNTTLNLINIVRDNVKYSLI